MPDQINSVLESLIEIGKDYQETVELLKLDIDISGLTKEDFDKAKSLAKTILEEDDQIKSLCNAEISFYTLHPKARSTFFSILFPVIFDYFESFKINETDLSLTILKMIGVTVFSPTHLVQILRFLNKTDPRVFVRTNSSYSKLRLLIFEMIITSFPFYKPTEELTTTLHLPIFGALAAYNLLFRAEHGYRVWMTCLMLTIENHHLNSFTDSFLNFVVALSAAKIEELAELITLGIKQLELHATEAFYDKIFKLLAFIYHKSKGHLLHIVPFLTPYVHEISLEHLMLAVKSPEIIAMKIAGRDISRDYREVTAGEVGFSRDNYEKYPIAASREDVELFRAFSSYFYRKSPAISKLAIETIFHIMHNLDDFVTKISFELLYTFMKELVIVFESDPSTSQRISILNAFHKADVESDNDYISRITLVIYNIKTSLFEQAKESTDPEIQKYLTGKTTSRDLRTSVLLGYESIKQYIDGDWEKYVEFLKFAQDNNIEIDGSFVSLLI